jgi:hypothetical protein
MALIDSTGNTQGMRLSSTPPASARISASAQPGAEESTSAPALSSSPGSAVICQARSLLVSISTNSSRSGTPAK